MDTTRGFLEAVIAWDVEGFSAICWQRADLGWKTKWVSTIDDALNFIDYLKPLKCNIYFSLARFEVAGARTRDNALAFRSIPFDVDVKAGDPEKYGTVNEASKAVHCFCQSIGIPYPSYVVGSGSGIHSHHVSDRSLPRDEWLIYAAALKRAAQDYGLRFDPVVTSDAARVLRVPGEGINNVKRAEPAPVRLYPRYSAFSRRYNFATEFSFANVGFGTIGVNVQPGPAFEAEAINANHPQVPQQKFSKSVPGFEVAPKFRDLPVEDLGEGIAEVPPLPFEPIAAGCEWLRVAYETHGKEYSEPQWKLMILACVFLEGGYELSHRLGDSYPTYSRAETDAAWQHKVRERERKNLGWPGCAAIANAGSRVCQSCPHFKEGKSPLHLGLRAIRRDQATGESDASESGVPREDEEERSTLAPEAQAFEASLHLPTGYTINEKGYISKKITRYKKIANKMVAVGTIIEPIFTTKIENPHLETRDGVDGIVLTVIASGIAKPPQFITLSQFEPGAINDIGITYNARFPKQERGKGGIRDEIMVLGQSWMEKLRDVMKSQEPSTLGWQYEHGQRVGFACGRTMFWGNGDESENRLPTDDELYKWFIPEGKPEPWFRACKLLTDRQQPELDVLLAVPFAAPLTAFLGNFYGGIFSVWGHPGTGKSTAQQVSASVWGHPKQTRESLDSTRKSITHRLGKTKNLPGYWDDVQSEDKLEQIFNTMFLGSQGIEGSRLTSDVRSRERLDWQTLLVLCGNASFVEYVIKKQPSTTAGLRRVLEVEFQKPENEIGMVDELDAMQAFGALEYNYGWVGMQYAKLLATEHDQIKALVEETTKRFKSKVKGKAEEAYWWGIAGTLLTGAALARRLGAEMDVGRMEEFLIEAFENNRTIRREEGTEGGSQENTDVALAQFLNFYLGCGNSVYTDFFLRPDSRKPVSVLNGGGPGMGRPVYVHVARDDSAIRISKKVFREFLEEKNIKTRQVFDGLSKYYLAKPMKVVLAGGTEFARAQEQCIHIPVGSSGPLAAIIDAHGETQADIYQGRLE